MSSRKDKLEKEILPKFEEIDSKISNIDVAGLSTEDRDEIAHLKKVFKYIYEMLKSLDPDFIPIRTIDATKTSLLNIDSYLNGYSTSSYIDYVRSINEDYLDTLLRDLMPFFFYKGKIAESLEKALNEYSTTISEHASSYLNEVKQASITAQESLENIENIASDATNKQELFIKYSTDIFGKEGLKNKISELVTNFEKKSQDINKLHQNIFDKNDGIEVKVNEYLSNGKEQNDNLNNLTKNSEKILEEIKAFHKDVFGEEDEYGILKGGLKNELLERKSELDEFKTEQQKRYDELNSQIESLLPGATSAGLSSAYSKMHAEFSSEVRNYGRYFYFSIVILLLIIVLVNIPSIWNHIISLSQDGYPKGSFINNFKVVIPYGSFTLDGQEVPLGNRAITILDSFIYKLPFILPAIWLVLFVSRRRNEAQRLAQEYAHKEVLAKSYESYKQQIEKLSKEEQNKLLPILMANMLKAIALNPAETLDKNHKEPTPMEEVIKKKEFWDFIEKIKNLMPKKEG
jgi:hypothetical protein